MATQIGLLRITGTVGGICFYRMGELYYARKKSSLTGKRVKTDPAFASTMRYAARLADASKIASAIYRQTVPKEERCREKYREIVSIVMKELTSDVVAKRASQKTFQQRFEKYRAACNLFSVNTRREDSERRGKENSFIDEKPVFVLQQKLPPGVTARPLPVIFRVSQFFTTNKSTTFL